jgi:hypothetical protein
MFLVEAAFLRTILVSAWLKVVLRFPACALGAEDVLRKSNPVEGAEAKSLEEFKVAAELISS